MQGKTGIVLGSAAAAAAVGVLFPSSSAAVTGPPTRIEIEHADSGCHTWDFQNAEGQALTVRVARGGVLDVLNEDPYPQKLVQVDGPAKLALPADPVYSPYHQTIQFPKAGAYRLVARPLQYMGPKPCRIDDSQTVLRLRILVK